jgi:hypothetical protein
MLKRKFEIIEGTGGSGPTYIDNVSTGGFTGIVDADGTPYFKGRPRGGNQPPPTGGGHDVTIATLETRLQGAFFWLGLLTAAVGVAFLFLIARNDAVGRDVTDVKIAVAAQGATLQSVKEGIDRLAANQNKPKDAPEAGSQNR